jgi:hypothetical protein
MYPNQPLPTGGAVNFFSDQGWSNDGSASYVEADSTVATHVYYYADYHSARKIQNSYPCAIQGGREYVSKWGSWGLHQHSRGNDPYYEGHDEWPLYFYKLKTTHYGTLSSYPKTWVGAGGITHTITGTVTVPASVTLTVKPGFTANFNSGTSLAVNGTLNANNATFTRSSGSWGGILFNSGSGGNLNGCTINNVLANSSSAIVIYNTLPVTIEYCTINNLQGSTGGIYFWDVTSNNTYLYQNSIEAPLKGVYLYNSTTYLKNNSIRSTSDDALSLYFYSQAFLGSPYNSSLIGDNSCHSSYNGIAAAYHSNIYAGDGSGGRDYNFFGYNSNYNAAAFMHSDIVAKNNYWYPLPPQKIYYDGTSSVDYLPYIQ